MTDSLVLPTTPRNKREEVLLEGIAMDPTLINPELKAEVREYIKDQLSLVAWRHPPAAITRYSFEPAASAQFTHDSYNGERPTPRIVGIQTRSDLI